MTNTKAEKVEQLKKYVSDYETTLAKAEELKKALEDYTLENINIKFFKKYFNEILFKGESYEREYQKFSLQEPKYNFQKSQFKKRLYITDNLELELEDTKRQNILAKLNEGIAKIENWKAQEESRLARAEAVNEEEALADLKAVFEKHNAYILQDELLSQAKWFRATKDEE